ncbi:UNVERIFIED_CONTAM: hypothetical protein GTU68_022574 [Idotea baltica]|nr:hypothetical protein [Idotea baltica]
MVLRRESTFAFPA